MGRSAKGSAQSGLQPQPQASYGGPGQALQFLQAAQEEAVGLLCLPCQFPLPCARDHRPSGDPSDAHGIVQRQSSQPVITDPLQRVAEFPIIRLGKMIRIVLQQFRLESAKYLPNRGKFLRQRMFMPRSVMIGRNHHHPSHAATSCRSL